MSDSMLTLEISFINGQYHSTPWNSHVNEGVVEWPPSTWRILRALISVWHYKATNINENIIRNIIKKLSDEYPSYHLPHANLSHTRHYIPGKGDHKDKVFDSFAAVDKNEPLYVIWNHVILNEEEKKALNVLLNNISYLGRAESWASASIYEGEINPNCEPFGNDQENKDKYEKVNVLVPVKENVYKEWRDKAIISQKADLLEKLKTKAKLKGKEISKLSKKDEDKIEKNLPKDIFEALHWDTKDIKGGEWSQPPGSEWIPYKIPEDPFGVKPKYYSGNKSNNVINTVARFAVSSQVPPRLTDAIHIADRIHTTLVKYSNGLPTFTGCDNLGKPLKGHKHVYILPESNKALGKGNKGEITHVTLYFKEGIGEMERQVLDKLNKIWGTGGYDIQLVLLGVGNPEDFGGMDPNKGLSPILAKSRTWISRTPFVPTRHPKTTRSGKPKLDKNNLQIGSPIHDAIRLLKENGYPDIKKINYIYFTNLGGRKTNWLEFKYERMNGNGSRGSSIGYGFKVEFKEEVSGPIVIGYGAHFGMGLFVPYKKEGE
ncbi:MAG: type I-G CRISPR-associated protein Csb2 [Thermoplasmata archaeon]